MKLKNYILLTISTLTLAGCTSEDITNTPDDERIPLRLEATLSGDRPVTRAEGSKFADDDELWSYVEHVSGTNPYTSVQGKLVNFTYATESTAMYWDDFSKSTESGSEDLRTKGHGLRSKYGYCYNGTDVEKNALNQQDGIITWTTTADQSKAVDLKKNDLLWSNTQAPISYNHAKDAHGTLNVPFTHAMSKFTVVLVAGDGFKAEDLDKATVTLSGMNETGTFSAPDTTVSNTSGSISVKMYGNDKTILQGDKPYRSYEAVVVPLTQLTSGYLLATIENMSGNKYEVNLSDAIIKSWDSNSTTSLTTQSGINYKLTVTLNKQAVGVVASLASWSDVSATGIGEIMFTADVKGINKDNDGLMDGDSFTLWKTAGLTETDITNADKTTVTYNGSEFTYDSKLYWNSATDVSYFRALAKKTTKIETVAATSVDQGTDLLWGTTAAHKGYSTDYNASNPDNIVVDTYDEGAAIKPRTGAVPLIFKHAMSKVQVNLITNDGTDAAVDLSKAAVTMTSVYDNGIIDIASGGVSKGTSKNTITINGETLMVPQEIDSNAKLIINLNDNTSEPEKSTTYSLLLNTCTCKVNEVDIPISIWESGKSYIYTITINKEVVKFRVLVQDWDKKTGSGNATLDWD